ncbi:MAG: substrate-binding domain-containing protein [Gammaproteobacteria bacterium]
MKKVLAKILILLFLNGILISASAEERLRMATTTSTENSGLLEILNPVFEKQTGIKLDVIAVGTGKAIKLAENGDVDLILVHAPSAEKKFIEAGYGIDRKAVMYNDFVLVGPKTDPANVKKTCSLNEAMQNIFRSNATFISRGDDSGTHKKERAIWNSANKEPGGNWYLAVGQGMGAVLKIANDKQAYTLTDRGTWLAYRNKMELEVVSEGDPILFNPYHVIAVNPQQHAHTKYKLASEYINFITSEAGQALIQNFKVKGEQLFHPDVLEKYFQR